MEESNLMIQEYAKNPLCNYAMEDYSVKQQEGNFICGDDISVYLRIEDNKIVDYSFDGNSSSITIAAASFLSEFVIGKNIEEVLTWSYNNMLAWGFEVSLRRRRAAVIAILAVRNAVHAYLKDGIQDTFDDVLDD